MEECGEEEKERERGVITGWQSETFIVLQAPSSACLSFRYR